jgi:protein-disulfide isomerase
MKTYLPIALAALAAVSIGQPLHAQAAEPGITRQQADQILQELRQIRQLLEKQGARPSAVPAPQEEQAPKAKLTDLSNVSMLGNKNAPLTIVEYTDYQCPFCQRFHSSAFQEIKRNYIDTGKVRFYSKDLPLDIHGNAMQAAQAARCAAEQGKFWELRDIMGNNPDKLDIDHISVFADGLKMDSKALRACIGSGKYKEPVQSDVLEAMRVGASGTPAFIVGKSNGAGVDGELMVGAMPYQMFDDKLKQIK